ncbi:hypothetical protein Y032_1011g3387 [Ancylostoma ceylanicum]|nr:hypothetical protein Y032_1011g3387 [Ancylostoma ceylanicum]
MGNEEKTDIVDYCARRKIDFKFIPSYSLWQGGLYEKMIHVFKISFKHALNNRRLKIQEILTIAKESEAIVNSRPLTYVSEENYVPPLRPIDFLRPWTPISMPRLSEPETEWTARTATKEQLLQEWKTTNETLNRFGSRWCSEYLTSLREQYRTTHPHPRCFSEFTPKKDDIVLIQDKTLERGQWQIGQITSSPRTATKEQLLQEWKTTNETLNRFWSRWCSEYLTSLREQYRTTHPHPRYFSESTPKKDDIVLIQDKTLERGQWQIGQITSSSDGFQRSAEVRLPSRRLITRPINQLYKFEVESGKEHETEQSTASPDTPTQNGKGHPMMTRSKTLLKNAATLLTLITIFTSCGTTDAKTRCPSELTVPKTVIYATNCVSKGVAIAKYQLDGKDKLCCTSSRTASSKVSAIPFEIASYVPSHVCSFQPSSKCDSKKKIGTFNQVELYDGTLLVVPELHIAIKEYLDPEDFVCFDLEGSQQPPKQPYTGTSYFCDKNECHDNAPLFCTFGAPSAIFTTPTGSFVMKAWGITTRTYYGHLPYTSPNVTISITCVKGGAEVTTNLPVDALEACIGNYCLFVTNSTDSQVIFPTSLIAFDYDVDISVWSSGKLIQRKQLHCKAHAVCELMECTFCLEFMYNSHCWTKVQLAMSGIIAISILT